jgi:UDP-N-acetylglucosamine 4,6-dehydratase
VFNGKSILITGGTGSFGRRFVSYLLANYAPKRVVVYSRDELKQYEMEQEVNSSNMRFFIGDVRDKARLITAMHDVDFVVHAAALKQVPAAEYNPMECIKTNILGGQNVIEAAIAAGVKKVIALSTDKAANPINLYGATKLASDKLFVAGNNLAGGRGTRFSVVRYGNVVGSRGSVLQKYEKIRQEGKKIYPVTDERMTRFWITLDQGVEFVVRSFSLMKGGEIFVPKLPSVRIVDLVKAVDLAGEIEVVGIRPGEKLHEIMCPAEGSRDTYEFKDYFVIAPAIKFFDDSIRYGTSTEGDVGNQVEEMFEYCSGTNSEFLTITQLQKLNSQLS